jgi:hypothetical protein
MKYEIFMQSVQWTLLASHMRRSNEVFGKDSSLSLLLRRSPTFGRSSSLELPPGDHVRV